MSSQGSLEELSELTQVGRLPGDWDDLDNTPNKTITCANITVATPIDSVEANVSVQKVLALRELVAMIMMDLPTPDIKSCNGVNRLWHQEARRILLERTSMDFYGGSPGRLQTQVESYMEEMGDDCHHCIKINHVDSNAAEQDTIGQLSNKYGTKIQHLKIKLMPGVEFLRSFSKVTTLSVGLDDSMFQIPNDLIMPAVTTLNVKISRLFRGPDSGRSFAGFTHSLLQMCPMLENLNLDGETQPSFLRGIQQSELIPYHLRDRTSIGINFMKTNPSRQLKLNSARITRLEIDMNISDPFSREPVVHSLQQLVADFAPTLKHLNLYGIPSDGYDSSTQRRVMQFPVVMPNLERLEITHFGNVECNQHIPLFKFIFGDGSSHGINDNHLHFPVLKKLRINPVSGIVDELHLDGSMLLFDMFFPDGSPPCHTMTSVDMACISWIITHREKFRPSRNSVTNGGLTWNLLKRMITLFPNVTKFDKAWL